MKKDFEQEKRLIKEQGVCKLYFGKMLKLVGLVCVTASVFTSCAPASEAEKNEPDLKPIYTVEYSLPTTEELLEDIEDIYNVDGKSYGQEMYLNQRAVYPRNGEAIKVNLDFEISPIQRDIFAISLEEYNNIFEVINPKYKFELNENPTEQDLLNPYNINLHKSKSTDETPLATTHLGKGYQEVIEEVDGLEALNTEMTFYSDTLASPVALSTTFKHEFLHALGAADAYEIDSNIDTIMQGYSKFASPRTLTNDDVVFLTACYRDTNLPKEELFEYANSYQENLGEFSENLDTLLLEGAILENIQSYYTETYGQSDENLEILDTNFGKGKFMIGELPDEVPSGWTQSHMVFENGVCKISTRSYYSDIMENQWEYETSKYGFVYMEMNNNVHNAYAHISTGQCDEILEFSFSIKNFYYQNENGEVIKGNPIVYSFNASSVYYPTDKKAEDYFDYIYHKEQNVENKNETTQKQTLSAPLKDEGRER